MATATFTNATDTAYETTTNWHGGGAGDHQLPISTDAVVFAANCICTSDQSAVLPSSVTVNAGVTLTMGAGGHLKTQDAAFTFNATAVLAWDGGTITHATTGATAYTLGIAGGWTGTANGGTLNLPSAQSEKSRLYLYAKTYSGNAASRIIVNGAGGASVGYVEFQTSGEILISHVNFTGVSRLNLVVTGVQFTNCLFNGFPAASNGITGGRGIWLRDCWLYNSGTAMNGAITSFMGLYCENCVFGKTEADAASGNGVDLRCDSGAYTSAILHNCTLASATPVSIGATTSVVRVVSTNHNKVLGFKSWYGRGHTVETDAASQSGNGLKLITSASAADTDSSRLRYLIATIPAAHDDTIDITVYVKGTNTKTCTLRIDPDALFGTAVSYAETADGNWNQRTINTYTVNGAGSHADLKVLVPVYIDITGASETWYVDTMAVTIVGVGENQTISYEYVFDGFPTNDPVAPGAGGGAIHLVNGGLAR